MIKKLSVGEFKTRFSEVLDWVKEGKKVAVTYGKKKKVVGYFIPEPTGTDEKRKLGLLEGQVKIIFHDDFKMTEEEFLGS